LGLSLLAGYRLTTRMAAVDQQARVINARYMRAQDLLSTVRAQVLLGSVLVRDALLDPNTSTADGYRQRFEDSFRTADRALRRYVPVLDSQGERDGIAGLRREVDDFRAAMLAVLSTDSRQWARQSRELLQQRVVPKREVVIRISEQVQALNRSGFVSYSQATATLYRDAQRNAWRQFAFALALSLAIAALAGFYAGRLESRLRRQHARDRLLTSDLHRLSGRLVNAQEDERRMIARELHDEVGQALATIKVELSHADRIDQDPATMAATLASVRSITEGALHTIRDLSHVLHPALLDDLGLSAALDALMRAFGRRHSIIVDFQRSGGDTPLTPELELAVYRIVQEALNNIAKHARCSRCRLDVQMSAHNISVTLEDNGVGFDAGGGRSPETQGLGLIGIRERAAQFGGHMRIDSRPGAGTRLFVELPLPQTLGPLTPTVLPLTETPDVGDTAHFSRR
ncbi:MAG: sensor histidine kinase, partial [Acidobacteria bacterium]|nr:sensor histidine kinase [Acidobacteriota bacterium]